MPGEDDAPNPIPGRPPPPPASHRPAPAEEPHSNSVHTPAPRSIDPIRAGRLRTVSEVIAACEAGGACGSCRPDILELLEDLQPPPEQGFDDKAL